eukprot:10054136-Alexandrium_andersonii.AAC.1
MGPAVRDQLRSTQYGFRPERSTTDAIHIIRRAQELVEEKQHHTLHVLFLDWSKAFDKILPGATAEALRRFGIPAKYVTVIEGLMDNPVFS